MAGMILMPTNKGLNQLKEQTKDALQKIELLDNNKKKFWETDIFTAFYDDNKTLTALFDIPLETNLTTSAYYINVVANGEVIATGSLTVPIAFVKGVGGIQTLKFPIAGEAGDIIFKNNNFITEVEFEERYLSSVIDLYAFVKNIEAFIVKNEIDNVEKDKQKKEELQRYKQELIDEVRKIKTTMEQKIEKQTVLLTPKFIADGGDGISINTSSDAILKTITLKEHGSYVLNTRLNRVGNDSKDDAYLLPVFTNVTTSKGFWAYVGETVNPKPDWDRKQGNGIMYFYVDKNDISKNPTVSLKIDVDGSSNFNGTMNYMLIKLTELNIFKG